MKNYSVTRKAKETTNNNLLKCSHPKASKDCGFLRLGDHKRVIKTNPHQNINEITIDIAIKVCNFLGNKTCLP